MYNYLDSIRYDKFGAKIGQKFGNGLKTSYTYEPVMRRLSSVSTRDPYGGTTSDMNFEYDPVGNITHLESEYPWRPGETFMEEFYYDDADQLTTAYESNYGTYSLFSSYGDYGKIGYYYLSGGTQNVEYYTQYPSCSTELESSQTVFAPLSCMYAPSSGNPYYYTGVCTYGINGSLRRRDNPQMSVAEYYLHNSAGNLKAYSSSGWNFAYYGYDAANARTYKLRMYNAAQWSNGIPVAWCAKVSGSGGADVSVSLSASMVQFMDFNGDGYADLVLLSTSCQHPLFRTTLK